MNPLHKWSMVLCVVAVAAGCFATSAQAEVLYREIFPTAGADNLSISNAGWDFVYDSTAKPLDSNWLCVTAAAAGLPNNVEAVNSSPASSELANGYAYLDQRVYNSNIPFAFWTEEPAGKGIQRENLTSISWYEANSMHSATGTSPAVQRIALKVAGEWYVSNALYNYNANPMSTGTQLSATNFTDAVWQAADIDPGVLLTRSGVSTTLPNGEVQGIGFYVPGTGGYGPAHALRIDSVQIEGSPVPEPNTLLLLGSGALGLLAYAWRKRK